MRTLHIGIVLSTLVVAVGCGKSSSGKLGNDGGTNPGGGQLTFATQTLPDGHIGEPYSAMLQATGGTTPYTFALADGSNLPMGLTLGADGAISGTPTSAGSSHFIVAVTDSASPQGQATGSLTLTIDPAMGQALVITTTTLMNGSVGMPYSLTLMASGGTTPYAWSLASGALPQGIALTADGKISGTPTAAGTSAFTIQVSDASSPLQIATATLMLTISPTSGTALAITTAALPNGKVGAAYTAQLAASGGSTPYTWSVSQGALPAGLTISGSGQISGTPSQVGMASFTVQVSDASTPAQVATTPLSIVIIPANGQTLVISTTSLPAGVVAHAYTGQLAASGGTMPYQWTLDATSILPPGLALASSGAITGSPTIQGRYVFSVVVSDASSPQESASGSVTLTITSTSSNLTITTETLPDAIVGTPYRAQLQARGGGRALTWSLAAGALPQGLQLNMNGLISGTASVAGTFSFNVEVTDGAMPPAKAEASLKLVVLPAGTQILAITSRGLPRGTENLRYAAQLQAMGGVAPYHWTVTNGTLPLGLTMSSTGAISGTASSAGGFVFTVSVTDSGTVQQSAQRQFDILVLSNPNGLTLATPFLRDGMVGQFYRAQFTVMGGHPPYMLALSLGTLPPGLNVDATMLTLTGTPAAAGDFNFTLKATDSSTPQLSTQHTYTLTIAAMDTAVRIETMTLPAAMLNVTYTATLAASRGTPPYAWSLANGALPTGLTLSTGGIISGKPTQAEVGQFSIRVMDSATPPTAAQRRFFLLVR
jgi:hypothetical protein